MSPGMDLRSIVMTTRTWFLVIATGLGALACAAPAKPAETGPAGQPKSGGTVNVRLQFDPFDWDLSYGGKSNQPLIGRAYQNLLTFQVGPDIDWNKFVLGPQLAESWEVSPDARTFTYHLRHGVKWY